MWTISEASDILHSGVITPEEGELTDSPLSWEDTFISTAPALLKTLIDLRFTCESLVSFSKPS